MDLWTCFVELPFLATKFVNFFIILDLFSKLTRQMSAFNINDLHCEILGGILSTRVVF